MHMRIVWGRILPGQWDAFEAAFTEALETRGEVKGLINQWLLRDQNDPNAGYSVSEWKATRQCAHFGKANNVAMLWPSFSRFS